MVEQFIFIAMLAVGIGLFVGRIRKIRRNIFLGRPQTINDRKAERWKTMARVALGQSKMVVRPLAGFFHILIYVGFVLINIEVLEILLDGITGSHRIFAPFLGGFYVVAIGFFEVLALLVMLACIVFLVRRLAGIPARLSSNQVKGWAHTDAMLILGIELVLMSALLLMNAAEGAMPNASVAPFLVSGFICPWLSGLSEPTLHLIERTAWWFHAAGILAFLNYLPFSKHFHIALAFPNVWYSKLEPKGKFFNHEAVKKEVELMMNPSADPYAASTEGAEPIKFGAKDVVDLSWKQLLDAYSCTECGRCSSECPAHQTGKLLSPRKIMMDTRDRLEEVGRNIDTHGVGHSDGKSLLGDFITEEELWACTTCNACTQACPVNIDPLSIIMDLRRELVLEQSKAPGSLTAMFNNVENNGAPWPFSPADRGNWRNGSTT
ncbi:MAG: 4Fe-4S dicluster domain-containing protein [Bacteroidia bacterium]|jgi:heterodisulfide reductase subunit C